MGVGDRKAGGAIGAYAHRMWWQLLTPVGCPWLGSLLGRSLSARRLHCLASPRVHLEKGKESEGKALVRGKLLRGGSCTPVLAEDGSGEGALEMTCTKEQNNCRHGTPERGLAGVRTRGGK